MNNQLSMIRLNYKLIYAKASLTDGGGRDD